MLLFFCYFYSIRSKKTKRKAKPKALSIIIIEILEIWDHRILQDVLIEINACKRQLKCHLKLKFPELRLARAQTWKKKQNKSIFLSPKCYGSLVWLKKYISSDSSWSSSKKGTMKDTRYITIKLPPQSGSDGYFCIKFYIFFL